MGFDPVSATAFAVTAASAASSAASGVSSIMGANARARGLEQQAKARQLQARYTQVQADQTATARREELRRVLGTITALRAGRGGQAAAGAAYERGVSRRANRGERIELLGFSAERAGLLREMEAFRKGQGAALLEGYTSAASSFLDAANAGSKLIPKRGRPEEII